MTALMVAARAASVPPERRLPAGVKLQLVVDLASEPGQLVSGKIAEV